MNLNDKEPVSSEVVSAAALAVLAQTAWVAGAALPVIASARALGGEVPLAARPRPSSPTPRWLRALERASALALIAELLKEICWPRPMQFFPGPLSTFELVCVCRRWQKPLSRSASWQLRRSQRRYCLSELDALQSSPPCAWAP